MPVAHSTRYCFLPTTVICSRVYVGGEARREKRAHRVRPIYACASRPQPLFQQHTRAYRRGGHVTDAVVEVRRLVLEDGRLDGERPRRAAGSRHDPHLDAEAAGPAGLQREAGPDDGCAPVRRPLNLADHRRRVLPRRGGIVALEQGEGGEPAPHVRDLGRQVDAHAQVADAEALLELVDEFQLVRDGLARHHVRTVHAGLDAEVGRHAEGVDVALEGDWGRGRREEDVM